MLSPPVTDKARKQIQVRLIQNTTADNQLLTLFPFKVAQEAPGLGHLHLARGQLYISQKPAEQGWLLHVMHLLVVSVLESDKQTGSFLFL